MPQPIQEKYGKNLRILVAPLDWGLGHVTRCIPVIKELLQNDCEVWLAGNETQRSLLQAEFPDLPFLFLPGYRVRYSKLRRGLSLKMLLQLPKIFSAVKKENNWLKKMIVEHVFDAVISDSRIGLWHKTVPCILITHQLTIKTGFGKWSEKILQKFYYRRLAGFHQCWVPDVEEERNLAGELSHPDKKPALPVTYIGALSRFTASYSNHPDNDHLLVIISGPEPQRTIFENSIVQQVAHYPSTATIARGLPGSLNLIPSTGMIRFFNHFSAVEMEKEMKNAGWVISRCGYSTVMDLLKMKKKSILVPTPGQTEQEYLAQHLLENKLAFCVSQQKFSLRQALKQAASFPYEFVSFDRPEKLRQVIRDFIMSLRKR